LAFLRIVSSGCGDETILLCDETIFRFWRRTPETADRYQVDNKTAESAGSENRRRSMRTFSFILAFAFVLAGPSIVGSSETSLPGVGTFAYSGSPIVTPVPQAVVVATLNQN